MMYMNLEWHQYIERFIKDTQLLNNCSKGKGPTILYKVNSNTKM